MEKRKFGRTGLEVSVLTFGCGAVGGLMTKGAPADQERAVARALEAGVNHFDTAAAYGDGASEQNVGRVLASLKPDIILSTKVRVPAQRPDIGAAIAASLESSLKRLGRDHVDVFQLHNTIGARADDMTMSVDEVLGDVVPALSRAREQGKTRFIGFTAIGETDALLALIASGAFDSAQVPYNALNPSAGETIAAAYPAQDYGCILDRAAEKGVGTIGIRALAGGALSGSAARNPLGAQVVEPIGSGADYAKDVARANRLEPMVREGHASNLTEMAMRFVVSNPKLSTAEIGLANIGELEAALSAVGKGPLVAGSALAVEAIAGGVFGRDSLNPDFALAPSGLQHRHINGRNAHGEGVLGRDLSVGLRSGQARGLREARRTGDPGGGREVSRARQPHKDLRGGTESALRRDRVRERRGGERRARFGGLQGGARCARQRGGARHPHHGRRVVTRP